MEDDLEAFQEIAEAARAARGDLEEVLREYLEARYVNPDGSHYGPAVRVRRILDALDSPSAGTFTICTK